MTERPDVSVVTVTHEHAGFIVACLEALAARRSEVALEVIVVDNASIDGTAALVRARFHLVRLIEGGRRRWYAANNNLAFRVAHGRHVLALNPDTEVRAGALRELVSYMDANPDVGLCGPRLVYPDGRLQPSCRRFPNLASVIARRTPVRRWLGESRVNRRHLMEDFDHTETHDVDWMLGACLLARGELLRTVGLMDEGYYLYVEDIDWAWRAHQAGWRVVYLPAAEVVHHHLAKSDHELLSRPSWLHAKSMLRFYRKHLAPAPLRLAVRPETLPREE
ncbi:MAG: glycosyl transferase family 2 [Myxococcaceae bacterium]|nr:glycosyl transferase family 2 [Myxococcaceae bacterium]